MRQRTFETNVGAQDARLASWFSTIHEGGQNYQIFHHGLSSLTFVPSTAPLG